MIFKNLFKPNDLWSAAKRGDVPAIEQFVAAGHDVNTIRRTLNVEGETPLHFAARAGQTGAIKTLVQHGAKINGKDDTGGTPLMYAVTDSKREDVIELLLDLGASIDAQDKLGLTALDRAAFDGDGKLAALLLKRGAQLNVGNGERRSSPVGKCISSGNIEVLKLLLQAGADVNAPIGGNSPLADAAVDGRIDFVKELLAAGADPNQTSPPPSGFTPLMSAVAGGRLEILETLVTAGANVNAVNEVMSQSALDIAEDRKRHTIVEFLKSVGARHAKDIPQSQSETKEEPGTFWQLHDDSVLSVAVEPWPPRGGTVHLKAEKTTNDGDESFSGTISYRLANSQENDEPWEPMPRVGDDEDGSIHFEVPVRLDKSPVYIQFRVGGIGKKDFTDLTDWKLTVK